MVEKNSHRPAISPASLSTGDFQTLARAISLVENSDPGAGELLKSLNNKHIPVIGITGPPGAGKSTLVDALIKNFISNGKKLAIICVDPSSSFHSGALLGDRIRLTRWYNNPQVFIRSMASRGSLGGLNSGIIPVTDLLAQAGFDYILIETVGVGQTEVEITRLADIVVLVLVPESGDEIQSMKSGIMEIGDIFVVNKSDRPGAEQFMLSLKASVHFQKSKNFDESNFIQTIAVNATGVDELYKVIIENINRSSPHKALNLLVLKAWQLISAFRMRDVNPENLRHSIEKASLDPGFNIYQYVESASAYKPEE